MEEPCEVTHGQCAWTDDDCEDWEYDDGTVGYICWDTYCKNCFKSRDWDLEDYVPEKQEQNIFYNESILKSIFDAVTKSVMGDGGDGDGFLCCRYTTFGNLADLYENYLKENNINLIRSNYEDYVSFSYGDEGIIITDKLDFKVPDWYTIKIYI